VNTHEWVERLKGEGVKIEVAPAIWGKKGDQGEYAWTSDVITITPDTRISTLFHELSHWTGHPSRLHREGMKSWNPEDYGREELVAWRSTERLGSLVGFTLDALAKEYHEGWRKKYPSLVVEDDSSRASSYLVHRFGL